MALAVPVASFVSLFAFGASRGVGAFGFDWKEVVDDAVNSGKPVKGSGALVIIVPTLLFVAARSLIGFARGRLQRELWRRDVARLEEKR